MMGDPLRLAAAIIAGLLFLIALIAILTFRSERVALAWSTAGILFGCLSLLVAWTA
jgi:hypothetical protein